MLVRCCLGSKYHLDCKRDPHVVSGRVEASCTCQASAAEGWDFCVSLRRLEEVVKLILLDSEKRERSASSSKSIFDFLDLFDSCLQNIRARTAGIARLGYPEVSVVSSVLFTSSHVWMFHKKPLESAQQLCGAQPAFAIAHHCHTELLPDCRISFCFFSEVFWCYLFHHLCKQWAHLSFWACDFNYIL